jgi:hypothetical protein
MVKIITTVVNNVDFIEIQYHTFKKYFKGEYEYIVFNDAKNFADFTNYGDITIKSKIKDKCAELGVKCLNIQNMHHKNMNMSERHADTFTKYVIPFQIQNPDKYLLIDSDMFLVDYFDIEKYFKYDCAIVLQNRNNLNYFWPGLCYMDFTKIKNTNLLNWGCINGLDSGGAMQEWLKKEIDDEDFPKTDDIRWVNKEFYTKTIYFIKHLWSCSWNIDELPNNLRENKGLIAFLQNDVRNINNTFFCEIYDNVFLHYRAGGNWRNEGIHVHNKLTNQLKQVLTTNL